MTLRILQYIFFCLLPYCSYSQLQFDSSPSHLNTIQRNCIENYYTKTYSNGDSTSLSSDMVATSTNDLIVCGGTGKDNPNDPLDAFIIRLGASGQVIWEKALSGPGTQRLIRIIRLMDGNFLATGYDDAPAGIYSYFLLKFDGNGNTIWRKDFGLLSTNESMGIRQIKEDHDGSIMLLAYHLERNLSFQDRMLIMKFDASGNLVYSNHFGANSSISVIYSNGMLVKNGFTYVVGAHWYSATNNMQGFLSKINNATGSLLWTKVYSYNNDQASFLEVFDYPGSRLCILGQDNLNSTNVNTLLICDTAGNVETTNFFQYGGGRQSGNSTLDSSGNLLYANRDFSGTMRGVILLSVNAVTGKLNWAKHHPKMDNLWQVTRILYSHSNSTIYCNANSLPNNKYKFFVSKFDPNGDIGCLPEDVPVTVGTGASKVFSTGFVIRKKDFLPLSKPGLISASTVNEGLPICRLIDDCSQLQIRGDDTLCHLSDTLVVTVIKNPSCFTLPQLLFDATFFKLISYQNGIAKLKSLKPGISRIEAALFRSCDTLSMGLNVHVFNSPLRINLGFDTTICLNNKLILHAGAGFESYSWQDGSLNSTYQVTQPGTYFVQGTDACGNIYRDSILIESSPPIPFDLGSNLIKCNDDSITISAPAGFINYFWSPGDITGSKNSTITVNPSKDTIYNVKAEKTPGCFAFDSIRITVHHSPTINLGADKNLCSGDSIKLSAGPGFDKHLWNSGDPNPEIIAFKVGVYSIIATDTQGCESLDTVRVLNVYNSPVVNLDKDSTLCIGSTKTLHAGNNFLHYLWNTGGTGKSVKVISPGTYYVSVVDINGCKGSDTTTITTLLAAPSKFLPGDTTLCNYRRITLAPKKTFNSYLWSTGGKGKDISISIPGLFWLEVSGKDGCTGKDSIMVTAKDCLEGFYVPNAFTPNGDGKNDIFRPLIHGNVMSYRFTVYNRWGEIAFISKTPGDGWDGMYKSMKQDGNVFVWTCVYQLESEAIKSEKGTVVLLR